MSSVAYSRCSRVIPRAPPQELDGIRLRASLSSSMDPKLSRQCE
jgi:hypothetical protein